LVVQVILNNKEKEEEYVNAVFLDMQKSEGKSINGVLIEVNENELDDLDIRETQYSRIEVTDYLSTRLANSYKVFAYMGKPEFSAKYYNDVKILSEYEKIISSCIHHWGREFYDRFNITTEPHSFEKVNGTYRFLSKRQNVMTGHKP
jgi:hypothetical protein